MQVLGVGRRMRKGVTFDGFCLKGELGDYKGERVSEPLDDRRRRGVPFFCKPYHTAPPGLGP